MNSINLEPESISYLPALLGSPQQWISDREYLKQQRIEEVYKQDLEREEIDISVVLVMICVLLAVGRWF